MNEFEQLDSIVGTWQEVTFKRATQYVDYIIFYFILKGTDITLSFTSGINTDIFPVPSTTLLVLGMLGVPLEEIQEARKVKEELDLSAYIGKQLNGLIDKKIDGTKTWFYLKDLMCNK